MFTDPNTAWILTQQRMQDLMPPEYSLHVRELQRERRRTRRTRRAWWHATMLLARAAVARVKRVVVA